MKKDEMLVVECKHVVYGTCKNTGAFSCEGESVVTIPPYKYTESEVSVHLAKGALDAFLDLNAKYQKYECISELNVRVSDIARRKDNGERTTNIQQHLKK